MIQQIENSFIINPTSLQNRHMEIQYGAYLEDHRKSGNVSCFPESTDSVDDFINKHSAFLQKNVNASNSSISKTDLASDDQSIFKPTNINPVHYFGNELLLSILLNSNLKMNKLMYTLALEMQKQKQNRELKRFIKLLRKYRTENSRNNGSSSHVTCKFSSALSNFYAENVKDVSQLHAAASGDKINRNTINVEINNLLKPQSILKKTKILTETVPLPMNNIVPFTKKVQYSDLQENHLYPKQIESNLDVTTSGLKEINIEKMINLDQPKSLEDIGNIIEHQIKSLSVLIEDFKGQISEEKDDGLCLQHEKTATETDDNIANQKERNSNDFSRLNIEKYETTQRKGSCVLELRKISEERIIYNKIEEEVQKTGQNINVIDEPKILENIENKINQLVDLIQLLIEEVKEQKLKEKEDNLLMPDAKDKTEIDCNALNHKEINTINAARFISIDKNGIITQTSSYLLELAKILENKENGIRNIQSNCYYGSTLKLFLTEKATEISQSYLNAEINVNEVITTEANSDNPDKETTDNTRKESNEESLSILDILRICKQFVKQLLSCVSVVDYSYLGCRKFSYLKENRGPTYICNICEEGFYKASVLNDHIKGHNLDLVRDYDECKHVLETRKLDNGEQFECQFCKQRFMRAYCCELHQQSCAKRLGLRHDVDSNLILLR